jgi:hypothetical protein
VTSTTAPARRGVDGRLVGALLVGAAVSVALGVYGRVHDGTGETVVTLFFAGQIQLKAWFATLAVALAAFQLLTAMRLFGKIHIPRRQPTWLGDVHRLSGTLAFIVSLPVAYHCLWSIGFNAEVGLSRVFVHSLFGCLFYGAFAAKVLVVRSKGLPGWALPLVGGAVFTALVTIWFTSAYWFFTSTSGPKL